MTLSQKQKSPLHQSELSRQSLEKSLGLEMAGFEQALRVSPLHQTSFDKHKGFTLLQMGTEPHCVRTFYFPIFVRSSLVI